MSDHVGVKKAIAPGSLVWAITAIIAVLTVLAARHLERVAPASPQVIYNYLPHTGPWHGVVWGTATIVVLAAYCILFGIHFYRTGDSDDAILWRFNLRVWKVCFLVPWVIVPPIWYSLEYFIVYTPPPLPSPVCLQEVRSDRTVAPDACALQMEVRRQRVDEFVHGQEVVGKVWLAVSTLLTLLYFGRSLRIEKE